VVVDALSQQFEEDGSLFPYLYPFQVGLRKPIKNGWKMTLSFNSSIGFRKIPTLLRGIHGS
jgi:hypothetical protein